MEEFDDILMEATMSMEATIEHLNNELVKIRAGRANPSMLEGLFVDYYGASTPLNQVANVSTPDARTLTIQPWEKNMLQEIERAIINSNLGFNPQNNGDIIIINIPALTEERRHQLVKQAKAEGENAKVGIRNARKDANDQLKKLKDTVSEDLVKDFEEQIQQLTDKFVKRVDEKVVVKEQDIMKV